MFMPVGELHSQELPRGDLKNVSLVELIGIAYARKITGRLDLIRESLTKQIYFMNGLPIYATSSDDSGDLLEVVAQIKKLPPEDTMQLRTMQKERGLKAEELIKHLGLLDNQELYALQVETFM